VHVNEAPTASPKASSRAADPLANPEHLIADMLPAATGYE